uniref:BLTX815 n=1 Tax=Nephila pilipes TaxID=299642 RepID=A0A076L378_NEPPI|nr:BLTX815 [Nephila pilipes]
MKFLSIRIENQHGLSWKCL